MAFNISDVCITADRTIRDAMRCIDRHDAKIALVIDDQQRLVDTITDGDVRRAILHGLGPDAPVAEVKPVKDDAVSHPPVTAPKGKKRAWMLRLMRKHAVNQVPLLDEDQRVVDLVTRRELTGQKLPVRALVMAGGNGTRLRPLTKTVPKPMVPVGDRPLLELIVERLHKSGIRRIDVSTHYLGDIIRDHFGDGSEFGVKMSYIEEPTPLGTAGSLALLEERKEPILVVNGDILTRVDFRAVLDFHRENGADMTVALKEYDLTVPYGVVDMDGVTVTGIAEKPEIRHFISAGVYMLNPEVREFIPRDRPSDMPELITTLVERGRTVVGFPIREYWLDIGQMADYAAAQEAYRAAKA